MPNVLIIITDDLGWGDVGFQGSNILTPNIDRRAVLGVRFRQMYGHPIGTPTRTALMTGLYPFRCGSQKTIWPWNRHGVPTHLTFMSQTFKAAGYDTWMVGKWNLGHSNTSYQPLQRGFDHHYGNYTDSIDHLTHKTWNVLDFHMDGVPKDDVEGQHTTTLYKNRIIELINDSSGDFFGVVSFNAPHRPLQESNLYLDQYSNLTDQNRATYSAMVTHIDDAIGEIVQALDNKAVLNDTFIWFISDNGGWTTQGATNGPLRDGKFSFYEGGLRLVSWITGPGLSQGVVTNQPMHVVDIFPTVSLLSGVNPPEGLDGIDMRAYLTTPTTPIVDREMVYHLIYPNAMYGCIRYGRHKLIHTQNSSQVFDIVNDPAETTPVTDNTIKNNLLTRLTNNLPGYVPDPARVWYQPDGYPPGFVFPEYWGEPNLTAQSVSDDADGEPPKNVLEMLGYPESFEV